MTINFRVILPQELDAPLMSAWRNIQSKDAVFASPYFCPEFTQLVGSVRSDARVVVIEDSARPVGFFPHQRSPLGMGLPIGGPFSDYHGVIAEPGSEWSAVELLRAANLGAWAFDHLVDPSGKFGAYVTALAASPQMDLSGGFEHYLKSFSDAPSDYARKARKLAREVGDLTFSLHDSADGPLEQMINWKSAQYRRSHLADGFAVRWTGDLVRRIADTQTAGFAGVCSVLRAGDHVVAVHVGMRSRQILHWWFPTYDQQFAKFSPGIILLMRLAEVLPGIGVHTIDLGKGDDRYKRSVMTGAAELREGFVERPSLVARMRALRRKAETRAARGGISAPLKLPLGLIRRIERARLFR